MLELLLKDSVTGICCVRVWIMPLRRLQALRRLSAGKSRGCKHYSFEYYRQARFSQIPNNQIILSNGVLKQNVGWY